ncbi:MAG: acyl-CoA desaturase [Aphanocapsa lilacina HA4352-LM1]|jgi:stearoyl-CoA desaturase (delta-9 desaturase)|nr:acyl-CoA desaturase [Aphanocapsa lilacina HA4352-LM1]
MPEPAEQPESVKGWTRLTRRRDVLDDPYIHRYQRRHFFFFDILPAIGTVAAVALSWVWPPGPIEGSLLLGLWLVTGFGVTVGYHRLFTHRSFSAAPWVQALLAVSGSMAGQGSVISWVALHRRHHELSDQPGDPHSPNLHGRDPVGRLRGLLHAHLLWMRQHEYPNVVCYASDLLRDRSLLQVNGLYLWWVLLGLAIPSLVGWWLHGHVAGLLLGFLWGGAVRMFVLGNIIWSINSFLHSFGPRLFATREHSRNSAVLALVSFGESWHNNHHAFPTSAAFGLAWYRLDPGYWLIWLLARLGLAWDVKVPSEEQIRLKRA